MVEPLANNQEDPGSNPNETLLFFLFLLFPFFKHKRTTSPAINNFTNRNQLTYKSNMLTPFLLLDWRRYSGNRAADAGKLVKLDHLEEVKVVTRFP